MVDGKLVQTMHGTTGTLILIDLELTRSFVYVYFGK